MSFDLEFFKDSLGVIGCDEVGRGPLAGPVVACGVYVKKAAALGQLSGCGICDSKKLSSKKRNSILNHLSINIATLKWGRVYQITEDIFFVLDEVSPEKIDEINILQASLLGMKNSCQKLFEYRNDQIAHILVDGNKVFESQFPISAIVKGDSKSLIIGLASIIAKEFRDEKMKDYDRIYPGYFFSKHAGYPTSLHREAIAKNGISPIHRKSFKGVKEYL